MLGGGLDGPSGADLLEAPSPAEFAEAVATAVHRHVPFDGYCLFGVDPASGLRTFMYGRDSLDGVALQLSHNETRERDLHRYVELAVAAEPVGVLSRTCSAEGARRSPRLHDILRPAGFGSELRLVLREHGAMWGAIVLFRSSTARDFTRSEQHAAAELSPALARVVRRHPMRRVPRAPDPLPAGIALLDGANQLRSVTPAAESWLDDLRAGDTDEMTRGDVTRIVFDAADAARARGVMGEVRCCARTRTGRWLALHAVHLAGSDADVAVTMQAADTRSVLATAVLRWRLTAREVGVLERVVAGLSTKQMARGLAVAPETVNTHLKALYRKAGVSGRHELVAQLM